MVWCGVVCVCCKRGQGGWGNVTSSNHVMSLFRWGKLNSQLIVKVFDFACRQVVIIHNILDVYARANDHIEHTLQLEHLRSRNGMGTRILYIAIQHEK